MCDITTTDCNKEQGANCKKTDCDCKTEQRQAERKKTMQECVTKQRQTETEEQGTTCKVMGHTEQAAQDARRRCFAMLDFFGLNSQFMSTTPDDKCSFRVRLYCKPHNWVSLRGKFQIGIIVFL